MEIKMHTAELIEGIEAPEINTKRKQKTAVPTNFDQEEDKLGRREALINFTIVVGGMALLNTLLFYVLLQLST